MTSPARRILLGVHRGTIGVFTLTGVLALATPAPADWLAAGFVGGGRTAANTLSIGSGVRVGEIVYEGHSWQSPIYYGWRVMHRWDSHPWFALEGEFTHAKAIGDTTRMVTIERDGQASTPAPLSTILPRFELSHGLNLALVNVVVSRPIGGADSPVAVVGRGGFGFTIPHVEAIYAGDSRYEYQMAGAAWAVGAGLEWRFSPHLYAIGDLRWSSAHVRLDIADTTITGTFRTTHLDTGVALKF